MFVAIARRSRHAATERATPRARGLSARTSLSRSHALSGSVPLTGRVRSSSQAAATHSVPARARRAWRASTSCSASRSATSPAAYVCCSSVSGRRNQSVRRSPLAAVTFSSPHSSDTSDGVL